MTAEAAYRRLETAVGDRDAPLAVVDLGALQANATALVAQAGGGHERRAAHMRGQGALDGVDDAARRRPRAIVEAPELPHEPSHEAPLQAVAVVDEVVVTSGSPVCVTPLLNGPLVLSSAT